MNNREIEKYILEQFIKRTGISNVSVELDTDDWGNYLNEAEILERKDYGRVWNVITYSTGRIRKLVEMGE